MRFFYSLLFGVVMAFSSVPSYAEGPIYKELREKLDSLSENLNEEQSQHFWALYTNANIIDSVHFMKSKTKDGVDECAARHDSLKTSLLNGYFEWEEAINESAGEAQGHVDNMIVIQDYLPQQDIKDLIALAQDTRVETNEEQAKNKELVTTREACNHLLKALPNTRERMVALLRSTLRSVAHAPIQKPQE